MPRSRGRPSPAKPPPFLLVLITLQQDQEHKYLSSCLPYELQHRAPQERAISDLAILAIIIDLCAAVLREETAERLLRPCKPRFCSRENPMTVLELVLAGFSESGLEVAVGGKERPKSERED